jgi:hypothetical protein
VDRSSVRFTGAGCLIALGLFVGGSAGVALADPGDHTNGHRSGGGRHGGFPGFASPSGFGQPSSGPGYRPVDGPRSRVGSGRRPGDATTTSNLSTPTFSSAAAFPAPATWFLRFGGGGGKTRAYNATGYLQAWTESFRQFAQVIVPAPAPPQPQPAIGRSSIAQEEPQPVNSTPGGGGGSEYHPASVPEPPVIKAPIVVAPPPVIAVPPVAVPEFAPPPPVGTGNVPWIPPRALAEPPAGAPPPTIGKAVPPGREPVPGVGTSMTTRASYRIGYSEYLRTAGVAQLVQVALPGIGGMLLLTASGGLIGYRQAKAGHSVRTRSIERFLN